MRFDCFGQGYSLQFTARMSNIEQTRPELVFIVALSVTQESKWKFWFGVVQHLLKIEPILVKDCHPWR